MPRPNPPKRSRRPTSLLSLGCALLLTAVGCDGNYLTPFVSADTDPGGQSFGSLSPRATLDLAVPVTQAEPGTTVEVEEGDIYRVLSGSLILNLNPYRGLQVIDISDVDAPEVIGRYPVAGYPVELYAVGDRAIVLLNDWQGFFREPGGHLLPIHRSGGVVLSIDLGDPSDPQLLDRKIVQGRIHKSRLVYGGERASLYVAGGGWGWWPTPALTLAWEDRTTVSSFDVSRGRLAPTGTLELEGNVIDIAATPEAMMIARYAPTASGLVGQPQSRVTLIDISDPSGAMIEGGEVPIRGRVRSQFNMDLHDGVLRVVSSSVWSDRTNHLETFDAGDLSSLTPIDHGTFGDNQSLFATLFLGSKAFFVTYLRIDPFHAFEIDEDGFVREVSEFVVSGWNDFFRPVFGESRLIGIGVDDANGRRLAVSLYDIGDLANPEPLIERKDIEADWSWSEASWDHRAFSVIENAVDVEADDGTPETGLVLLPYNACCSEEEEYRSTYAAQIFTFSATTLTRRGVMDHGSPVRRSFQADQDLTGNLSNDALSLFDTTDPDEPEALGRAGLSVNFRDFYVLPGGEYGARVSSSTGYVYSGDDHVEIVSRDAHPDTAETLASFAIPAYADIHQVGDLLVTTDSEWIVGEEGGGGTYVTFIEVWDLANPLEPRRRAEIETNRLNPSHGFWWYGPIRPAGRPLATIDEGRALTVSLYPYPLGGSNQAEVVGDAIAFLESRLESVPIEPVPQHCRPPEDAVEEEEGEAGAGDSAGTADAGAVVADTLVAGPVLTVCSTFEVHYEVEVLALTDPASPEFAETIALPDGDTGVDLLSQESDLWLSLRRSAEPDEDGRPQTHYFIQRIDLADPAEPETGTPINVPGKLLALDGRTVFTRDFQWDEKGVETSLARLDLFGPFAMLRARRTFEDQYVNAMLLDGEGHAVIDRTEYRSSDRYLTVLDADSDDLSTVSEAKLDFWGQLRHAEAGRAILQAGAGILVFNLEDPGVPFAQAYFATGTWPSSITVHDRQIIVPAGRYGIYAFGLDESNLPPVE